jgi:capsular exopolysaccharide synthesis family protein
MLNKSDKDMPFESHYLEGLFLDQFNENSVFAEAYRTLRTNIKFAFLGKNFKTLMITSAGAGEGKTTNLANLGYTIATTGKRVIMIDADLRKPHLSDLTGIGSKKSKGLSEIISESFNTHIDSGSLGVFGTCDLIRLVSFQKKTGVLSLQDFEEMVDIYFLNGTIKDVQWKTRPKEFRIATLLAQRGLVQKEQLKLAIEKHKKLGYKIGMMLLNMGLVSTQDLTELISQHMIEAIRVALGIKSGQYKFDDLPDAYFEKPSFDPVNIGKIYEQVIIGEEELVFLEKEINKSIFKTHIENLSLLPTGSIPARPNEMLDSEQMTYLLSYLKRRFDRVLIDTPPIVPASDALILAPQADGVIFVVQAGVGNRIIANKAIEQLRKAQANIIGVILNRRDQKRKGYYYKYYNSYYNKYYGGKS